MNKQDVQDWIDAHDRLNGRHPPADDKHDIELFYWDKSYDKLRQYLSIQVKKPWGVYWPNAVDLARELIKMPDEQWDLFVISGFKYYKEKDEKERYSSMD